MVAKHDFRDKFGKSKSNSVLFMFSSVLRWPRRFFWSDIAFVYLMALGRIDKSQQRCEGNPLSLDAFR